MQPHLWNAYPTGIDLRNVKNNIEMHGQFIGLSSDMAVKSQSFQSKHLSKMKTLKTLP